MKEQAQAAGGEDVVGNTTEQDANLRGSSAVIDHVRHKNDSEIVPQSRFLVLAAQQMQNSAAERIAGVRSE